MIIICICISVIIVVALICATTIYIYKNDRYYDIVSSSIYREIESLYNKQSGQISIINKNAEKALDAINSDNISDKMKIDFVTYVLKTINITHE